MYISLYICGAHIQKTYIDTSHNMTSTFSIPVAFPSATGEGAGFVRCLRAKSAGGTCAPAELVQGSRNQAVS